VKKIIMLLFLVTSLPVFGMLKGPQQKLAQRTTNWLNYQMHNLIKTYQVKRTTIAYGKILRKMRGQEKFQARAIKNLQDKWYDPYFPAFKKLRLKNAQRDFDDSTIHIKYYKEEAEKAKTNWLDKILQLSKLREKKPSKKD
jgi:hypothetical protein